MSLSRGNAEELLMRGLAAAKSTDPKDHEEALFYLEWVLRTEADFQQQLQAWYWLARIATDRERQRECLMNVLAIQPTHPDARRDLAILDGRLKAGDLRANPLQSGTAVAPGAISGADSSRRFRCPRCGATASYDPNIGVLRCQFCGTQLDDQGEIAQPAPSSVLGDVEAVSEQDWVAAIYTETGHRWALPQDRVLKCEGCGSTVTFVAARVSAKCAYCGSGYTVGAASHDLREPDGVVPFAMEASDASTYARKWLAEQSRSMAVPDDLADLAALQLPQPIYLPFWTFDIGGEVRWSGFVRADMDLGGVSMDGIDNAANIGGVALGLFTGNFEIAAQSVADITSKQAGGRNMVHSTGAAPVIMDDILVPATSSLTDEMLGKLTFDTRKGVPYREEILAAWPAEVYTISMSDASLSAREKAVKEANSDVELQTGSSVGSGNSSLMVDRSGLAVMSYKLLLVPIWTLEYTYKGESYHLLVNGQSGDVCGDVPRSSNPIMRLFSR
jgi:DNA-directed RNA polymerase subunit RPC12/RpoP